MQASSLSQLRVLVLSSIYEPIAIVSWQKAMLLFLADKVDVLESSPVQVRSPRHSFLVPSVIRLRVFGKPIALLRRLKFSRHFVFFRDEHRCQYCAKTLARADLTLDHVLPVVRGGKTSWDNIVTCCQKCNQIKADRTPEEARMPLIKKPRRPHLKRLPELIGMKEFPSSWKLYLKEAS